MSPDEESLEDFPDNIVWLDAAWKDYKGLGLPIRRIFWEALQRLSKEGPPKDAGSFPISVKGQSVLMATRVRVARGSIVFDDRVRVVHRTEAGAQIVRFLAPWLKEQRQYHILALFPPES